MSNSLMQWMEDGFLRPMVKDGTKSDGSHCVPAVITFLAGRGITDQSGFWTLDLSSVACKKFGTVLAISMVATPVFEPRPPDYPTPDTPPIPSYIQTGYTGLGGTAVVLYAVSWGCECKLEKYTSFDYHIAITHEPLNH
jgi:hypothetical protein